MSAYFGWTTTLALRRDDRRAASTCQHPSSTGLEFRSQRPKRLRPASPAWVNSQRPISVTLQCPTSVILRFPTSTDYLAQAKVTIMLSPTSETIRHPSRTAESHSMYAIYSIIP